VRSPSVPVLYGLPDVTAWRVADAGRAVLGGCMVDDSVNHLCVESGHGFLGPDVSWEEVEAAYADLQATRDSR
jgi:hypothetical protein